VSKNNLSIPLQSNIFALNETGDIKTSTLTQVFVNATALPNYTPNMFRTATQIASMDSYFFDSMKVINCPIVEISSLMAVMFPRKLGWYRDTPIQYYHFANPSNLTQLSTLPVYFMIDKNGLPIGPPIFTASVSTTNCTFLWEIYTVETWPDYYPNKFIDHVNVLNYGTKMTGTNQIVNFPLVSLGSTLQNATDANYSTGWFMGKTVGYFNFGRASPILNPLFKFIKNGMDYEDVIVDTIPGDRIYSTCWRVFEYVLDGSSSNPGDSMRDVAQAQGNFSFKQTDQVYNAPIVSYVKGHNGDAETTLYSTSVAQVTTTSWIFMLLIMSSFLPR